MANRPPEAKAALALTFHSRSSGGQFRIAAGLHVAVDLVDRRNLHTERAPGRHPLLGAAGADGLHEELFGVDGAIGLERYDEVRRERRAEGVLPVTARAVQVELLPPVVHILRHGISGRRVILVPELLSLGA